MSPTTAKDSTVSSRFAMWWLACGIGLVVLLHAAGVALDRFFGGVVWSHEPLHAVVETAGAVMGLGVACVLVLFHRGGRGTRFSMPVAGGLAAMSLLDAMHATVYAGESFVWLHSIATLAGGLVFATVWLPPRFDARSPVLVGVLSVAFAVAGSMTFIVPSAVPPMIEQGAFTPAALLMNLGGGALMIAAAVRLAIAFRRERHRDHLLFSLHCLLFGGAAMLFDYSQLWDAAWWWWHALRLVAYGVAISIVASALMALQRDLISSRDQVHESHEQVARKVREQNHELAALRSALDQHTLFSITDRKGRIVDVNKGFCRISGFSREELLGQDHRMLNSGHHPKQFWVDMWRTIAAGRHWRAEVCNRAKDGSLYWVDSTNIPQFDEDGNIDRFISLRFDITDKKKAEFALAVATEEARAASKAKSEFLANMSHEIRTPMTAILGFADLLTSDLADDPEQTAMAIRTIQANASHLLTIINDILDVSKIEAGQMTVEILQTDPMRLIEDVADLVRPRASGKGVEVRVAYETPMPRTIETDPTRLRQILLNLMGNAIKFTEMGSVTINAACDPQGEKLSIRVVDTGIGMTPEQRDEIARFEAFHQADTSMTRRFGGSGLGLRISNALATMLGDGITIESEQGVGSSFGIAINTGSLAGVKMIDAAPKKPTANEPAQPAKRPAASEAPGAAGPLAGIRILLAEDGPDNQRLISFHLRKAGAEVTVCGNGLIAAETVERANADQQPHVILMDMQMPELDGYGATRRLRGAGCRIPIVALTAHAMDGDRQRCIDAGCDDYQTKPIERAALIAACEHWAKHGGRPSLRAAG